MPYLSDQQLVEQIQQGQEQALRQLFDRYGANVCDFLYRIVGDADDAIRLTVEVFARFSQTIQDLDEAPIRGLLFYQACETALAFLRREGLDEELTRTILPDVSHSDLLTDVWQSACGLSAPQRATLTIVEHQGLSPSEQATALGITRRALADATMNARRDFRAEFDFWARSRGRPSYAMIDPWRIRGLSARTSDPHASLFAFLPAVVPIESVRREMRNRISDSIHIRPRQPVRALQGPARQDYAYTSTQSVVEGGGASLASILLGLALVVVLIFAILFVVTFKGAQPANANVSSPVITQVEPSDGEIVPSDRPVVVLAIFQSDQKIDVNSASMVLDGANVVLETTVTESSISYAANLAPGSHVAVVDAKDILGNRTSRTWQFQTVAPTETPSITPSPLPTIELTATPMPTTTRVPTAAPSPLPTPSPPPTPAQ